MRKVSLARTPASVHAILALVTLFAIALLPTLVHAARFETFDERVREPQPLSVNELREKVQSFFALFDDGSVTMLDVLQDPDLQARWVEIRWQLFRTIDERRLGSALTDFGITPEADGSYSVDLRRFPQWHPLDFRLASFFAPGGRDGVMQALQERGLRRSSIAALTAYLDETPQPRDVRLSDSRTLTESFHARVRQRSAPVGRIDRAELRAYSYQLNRNGGEATREWALGLLNLLDRRAQGILISTLMENNEKNSMTISPGDAETYLQELERAFLSGEITRTYERE